jgi:hypothetical protein
MTEREQPGIYSETHSNKTNKTKCKAKQNNIAKQAKYLLWSGKSI